jgi:hypothetical protein
MKPGQRLSAPVVAADAALVAAVAGVAEAVALAADVLAAVVVAVAAVVAVETVAAVAVDAIAVRAIKLSSTKVQRQAQGSAFLFAANEEATKPLRSGAGFVAHFVLYKALLQTVYFTNCNYKFDCFLLPLPLLLLRDATDWGRNLNRY